MSLSLNKHYASAENPLITAVISEMFRYENQAEAEAQLESMARKFVVSKKQLSSKTPSLHLWIRGFAVEEAETAAGIIGNFAIISYEKRDDRYVLTATKIPTERKLHPQIKHIKHDYANWGHPVLRALSKQKAYATLEEAQRELDILHRDFPKSSIPNPGKLYIIIYCSRRPAKERMVRHIVDIDARDDGQFILRISEQEKKKNPKKPKTEKYQKSAPEQSALGKHTAKLQIKRKRS